MPRKSRVGSALAALPAPTPWPGANARLLGVGAGLPVDALVRLAQFSADEFERFTVEWAVGYLQKQAFAKEVQWRGGAGDKGRDVVVWLDESDVVPRRWELYQCKRYDANLGLSKAGVEIAKVLHYTFIDDYTVPQRYHFVTHKGLTSPFQDLLDDPEKLKKEILATWDDYANAITSTEKIELTPEFKKYIEAFDFSIFKAKQPHDLIKEHKETEYHLVVFGAPLIDRKAPPAPPSVVAPRETRYVEQLFAVIGTHLKTHVKGLSDFAHSAPHSMLFTRSRLTFYSAEGLFELARDQFASPALFDSLLEEFNNGLYFVYTEQEEPMARLRNTVKAAQGLQLGGHPLADHMNAADREGMCHQLANKDLVNWCGND